MDGDVKINYVDSGSKDRRSGKVPTRWRLKVKSSSFMMQEIQV